MFIDDILISAATREEHLQILREVLKQLNFRLNRSKFLKPHLEHLGYIIDAQGRHPTEGKTRAIREAPRSVASRDTGSRQVVHQKFLVLQDLLCTVLYNGMLTM